jgi:hypothetical protein
VTPTFGLTPLQWGVLFVIFAALFLWLRIFARLRAVLIFAGICLLGQGLLSRLLVTAARDLSSWTGAITAKVFGAAIPGVLLLIVGVILIYDLHPRGGGASRRTFWLAAIAAALLIGGVSTIGQLTSIPHGVHSTITTVTGG